MLDTLHAASELQDLFGAQDNRQLLRFLGRRDDVFETPIPLKCDFVKKTQGGDGGQDGTDNQLLIVALTGHGQYTLDQPRVGRVLEGGIAEEGSDGR